jgi:predicted DNA-binding transcriptional regulator AlpA
MNTQDKFLRKQGVAYLLGISRYTLRRIMQKDPTFPRFIELSAGIHMVRQSDVEGWLRRKELATREKTARY